MYYLQTIISLQNAWAYIHLRRKVDKQLYFVFKPSVTVISITISISTSQFQDNIPFSVQEIKFVYIEL